MDTAEFSSVIATVREFVRGRVVPREQEIDEQDRVPDEIWAAARSMGLFGFALPEEHGGLGASMSEEVELVIELGYTTPALRSMFGTNNGIAGHVLLEGGTDSQKARWLPTLATGATIASFALTEPEAGSDPSHLTTVATRDGTGWRISGSKRYITNAPVADLFMVFARTGPASRRTAISAFLVPADTPGVTVAAKDQKMGQMGAWTADVHLGDVRASADSLVGGDKGLDAGYAIALRCLAHGRIHIAALCVGMTERLVDEMVAYARSRRQGGRPIASYQLVQGLIADSVTDLHAARALVRAAAVAYDSNADRRVGPSCAKYFCSEAAGRVADRAVQVFGGAGYMRGVAVERMYRDVRLFRIYEGTSQIQQLIIAKNVLGNTESGA